MTSKKQKVDLPGITDVQVGVSDSVLLLASIIGFCILAYIIYKNIFSQLKSSDEIDDEDLNYEEKLARADVTTLTRAQRRARAKAIMKEKRRATVQPHPRHDDGEENENNDNNVEPDILDDDNNEQNEPILSRKERDKAAKAAEREERKLYQEERERQQKEAQLAAQKDKQKRIKLQKQQQEIEKKNLEKERVAKEEQERYNYITFLESSNENDEGGKYLSVEDFIQELHRNRHVNIQAIAESFGVTNDCVKNRIDKLITERRVAGFFPNDHSFVFLSDVELDTIAKQLKDKGTFSLSDVAMHCQNIID